MPRSGEGTRAALISAGERLFAEHGVGGTTLASIVKAAGQRNNYAVGWHFGDRDGLVEAILRKHQEKIDARRAEMLHDAGDEPAVELIARALVEPLTDRVRDPDGGVDYLRIQADVAGRAPHDVLDTAPPGLRRLMDLAEPLAAGLGPVSYELQSRIVFIVVFHGLAAFLEAHPTPGEAELAECNELLVRDVMALLAIADRRAES